MLSGSGVTIFRSDLANNPGISLVPALVAISVQTTERYLGMKQDIVHGPNDGIKLRVAV